MCCLCNSVAFLAIYYNGNIIVCITLRKVHHFSDIDSVTTNYLGKVFYATEEKRKC